MERAAVALGANLGDRLATLRSAARGLEALGVVVARSSVWETAPVGGPDGQPAYLNAVVVLDTGLAPRALLGALLALEVAHGRVRDPALRWGPRTLDLDLLLHGGAVVADDDLDVPHPRLHERAFVLAPLLEAWPEARHPTLGPLAAFAPVITAAMDVVRSPHALA